MGSRGMSLIGCLMLVVGIITLTKGAEAATYVVGDDQLWRVPSDTSFYSQWASDKNFSVGDILNFTWTATHDVAEATLAQYTSCQNPNDITLNASGTINLNATGSMYFICTIGTHCTRGQKLAINVTASTSSTPSSPSPPPPPPSSSVSSVSVDALFATMSVLLVHFLA